MKKSRKPNATKSVAKKCGKKKTFLTDADKKRAGQIIVLVYVLAMAIFFVGCAGAPKITPHILDTQLNELREYEVLDEERMTIRFKKDHPLPRSRDGYGNGFFCAPQKEVAALRDWCLRKECTKQQGILMMSIAPDTAAAEPEVPAADDPRSSISTMQEWVLP